MRVMLFLLWIATGGLAYYFYQAQLKSEANGDEAVQNIQTKDQAISAKLAQDIADMKKQVSDSTTFQSKYEADEATIQDLRSQISGLHSQMDGLQTKVATTAAMGGTNTLGTSSVATLIAGTSGENWSTTDGHLYKNVKVLKVEPDTVTILDDDGGACVPIANLAAELQTRFHYDPAKAQAASDAKAQAIADAKKQELAARQSQVPPTAPTQSDTDAIADDERQISDLTASKSSLEADIDEKARLKQGGHGAYDQIINDDEAQINELDLKIAALNQKIFFLNRRVYIQPQKPATAGH